MQIAAVECRPGGSPGGLGKEPHALLLMAADETLPDDLPARARSQAVMARRKLKVADLDKTPLAIDLDDGRHLVLLAMAADTTRFERLSRLRKALALLLDESPELLAIHCKDPLWADDACYVALVNGAPVPTQKKQPERRGLARLRLYSSLRRRDVERTVAIAAGNCHARELTMLPQSVLTPSTYRRRLRAWARKHGVQHREYALPALRRMGAGAFCAVAQGSSQQDAAIVHLRYVPAGKRPRRHLALVGKGICFDTGGHNLKTARGMQHMHDDMAGSAVALGVLDAIAARRLPLAADCWLAIARNHLSPDAYAQSDIVTALDGTTIEVVHTDAEGRMVLADTLALATRTVPATELVIDFATLTGSMVVALGNRQSGIFASEAGLGQMAVDAGVASGERVCRFPLDDDYDAALESAVADTLQCTMDGEADHILAARFLHRFVAGRPWLHVDLSAAQAKGGLGAVGSDCTGFGVAWATELIDRWMAAS